MTLSPMEPNVSTNSCKGGVSLRFQALGVKCEEMGFKKTIKCVLFKGCIHERQAQHIEEVHFRLKIK
jgi:hypothetical protein